MDFSIPETLSKDVERFKDFLQETLVPNLSVWTRDKTIPRNFYQDLGREGWFGFTWEKDGIEKQDALREVLLVEQLGIISPGVAVAALAHADLGLMGLWLFGSEKLKQKYGEKAVIGETLMCVGNTETEAGSDVAGIKMIADKIEDGWRINGTKAYITNGLVSDMAIVTAVSDPEASRNRRVSMFLVDLKSEGVKRKKLNKQVWIPSDLTRVQFTDVFVPKDHLLGVKGRGLQQVLTIFTNSRISISALTLGTAVGAFELAVGHARKRSIFGQKIVQYQSKAFEIADFYAKIEAARLVLHKAAWTRDQGLDFRLESSLAKYLTVMIAREVTTWAADLFGAASVISEHPIHKFPMDAWASALGEGTQDVQKLVIFREVMKRWE
jgi:alkylation response protein AidB-like acyl-CoA dehydrogenase